MAEQRSTIEDHVTCSICMDLYKDPMALPCMHSFCRRCLFGIYSSSMILKCPECRIETKIGKGGIDTLPRNFQLGSIVDSYKKEHQVALPRLPFCAEHKTECKLLCDTCKYSICVSCVSTQNHSGHSLRVTAERRVLSNIEGKLECDQHLREASLYCKDCDKLICLECFITTHRDHLPQSVAVVHANIKDTLEATLSDLDARQRLLRATQKSCRTMAQKVQVDAQRKNRELSVFFDRLRETLDSKEASLKQDVDKREKFAVETYLTKAEQAAKKEQVLNEVINDVKRLLTEDKHGFFKDQKKITERANDLLDNEVIDSMPRLKGLDGVSLQTCSLDDLLSNVKWNWPDNDIKPVREAPPIPARRKTKAEQLTVNNRTMYLNPGCPVRRGAQWKDGMRDGGPGHYGTVIQTTVDPTIYMVRWPNGNTGEYTYIAGLNEEICC